MVDGPVPDGRSMMNHDSKPGSMRPLWIFGYGSLMWRPDLPFVEVRDVCVHGYQRRFWQASPDHRGTPEAPGRVVTLVAAAGAVCWGRAYRLDAEKWGAALSRLDHREKAGYQRVVTEIYGRDEPRPIGRALAYVATDRNPGFVGPAPLAEIAEVIRSARGPSGSNRDYLLALERTLAEIRVTDDHVSALADLVCPDRGRAAAE